MPSPPSTGRPSSRTRCFIVVEFQGPRWTVKADALTAPQYRIDGAVYDALGGAVIHLIGSRQIRPDSSAGPGYFVLHDVDGEPRARELASALHAALCGDLGPQDGQSLGPLVVEGSGRVGGERTGSAVGAADYRAERSVVVGASRRGSAALRPRADGA